MRGSPPPSPLSLSDDASPQLAGNELKPSAGRIGPAVGSAVHEIVRRYQRIFPVVEVDKLVEAVTATVHGKRSLTVLPVGLVLLADFSRTTTNYRTHDLEFIRLTL